MAADATVAALEALIVKAKAAAPQIAYGGALLVEQFAKTHASGPHGPTTVGVVTGDLRRSIRAHTPKEISPDVWESRTYPSVIYSRIQELGGHVYPVRAKMLSWVGPDGRMFAHHVYLPPRPYLAPGRNDAILPYWQLTRDRIAEALGV